MIADFFDITVDDLISNKNVVRKSHRKLNHILITASSCLLSFFIAAIVFLILYLCSINDAWKAFIVALPTSAITLIVLSSLWFNRRVLTISVVYLVLGSAMVTMVFMNFYYYWIILIAAGILCIMAVVFFNIRFGERKQKIQN